MSSSSPQAPRWAQNQAPLVFLRSLTSNVRLLGSCGLSISGLTLNGYTAGLDAGPRDKCHLNDISISFNYKLNQNDLKWLVGNDRYKYRPEKSIRADRPSAGPKIEPTGLLHGLNTSCWTYAGLRMNSLMLKG